MVTSSCYDFVLPFFTYFSDLRPAMMSVHGDADGCIYATNANVAIRVPSALASLHYPPVDNFPNSGRVFSEVLDRSGNTTCKFSVDALVSILSKMRWKQVTDHSTCSVCNGSGKEYYDSCGHSHPCDSCRGDGVTGVHAVPFTLLRSADIWYVSIGAQYFRATDLHVLVVAAKILGVEFVEMISDGGERSGVIFVLGQASIYVIAHAPGVGMEVSSEKVALL